MSDGGKGSIPRPYSVPPDQYRSNWDKIFKKKPEADKASNLLEDEENVTHAETGSEGA